MRILVLLLIPIFTLGLPQKSDAKLQCLNIFTNSQNVPLFIRSAIERGIEIFDKEAPHFDTFSDAYLHGTNVQTVQKMTAPNWRGNRISDYVALRSFSLIYPKATVTHAYHKGKKTLHPQDAKSLSIYARMSAQRAYLQEILKFPPSVFKDPLALELFDFINNKNLILKLIKSSENKNNYQQAILTISQMSKKEWSDVVDTFDSLKGLVVVIDGSVRRSQPTELDPEDANAHVIISPHRGLPVHKITAIVPLSVTDRNQLIRLLYPF